MLKICQVLYISQEIQSSHPEQTLRDVMVLRNTQQGSGHSDPILYCLLSQGTETCQNGRAGARLHLPDSVPCTSIRSSCGSLAVATQAEAGHESPPAHPTHSCVYFTPSPPAHPIPKGQKWVWSASPSLPVHRGTAGGLSHLRAAGWTPGWGSQGSPQVSLSRNPAASSPHYQGPWCSQEMVVAGRQGWMESTYAGPQLPGSPHLCHPKHAVRGVCLSTRSLHLPHQGAGNMNRCLGHCVEREHFLGPPALCTTPLSSATESKEIG